MIVNISDYGDDGNSKFVEYTVSGLLDSQMNYLMEKLDEETSIVDGDLIIKMYFEDRLYPFQSDVAKIRLDDFTASEATAERKSVSWVMGVAIGGCCIK